MKLLREWYNNISGFSIVEALITVVIVGIAIVPISVVFSRTVNTTLYTRKQMLANEYAQGYIEALQVMSYDELQNNVLGSGNTTVTISQTELASKGLTDMSDQYELTVNYDVVKYDIPAYRLPVASSPVDVDIVLKLESADRSKIGVYEYVAPIPPATSASYSFVSDLPSAGTNVDIIVEFDRSLKEYTLKTNVGGSVSSLSGLPVGLSDMGIRFEFERDPVVPVASLAYRNIKVTVDSEAADKLNLYFYEDEDNEVDVATEILAGYVSVSRNLKKVDEIKRISEIEVVIKDSNTGEVLTTMTTTKIDE